MLPGDPPPIAHQPGPLGVWHATQITPTYGLMAWGGPGPDDGPTDRINDQVHPDGTWIAGPGNSMSWIPAATPESEDPQ
jgi:hypothetical protein